MTPEEHWAEKSRQIAEKARAYNKQYRQQNKDKLAQQRLEWKKRNQEKVRLSQRMYTQQHRTKINKKRRQRSKTDPVFVLVNRLRTRLSKIMKRLQQSKPANTQYLLGADWQTVLQYIESLFLPGMTWDNRHLWHIDHIKPIASFNHTEDGWAAAAFHYTNLQPLWAKDNMTKGAKY